MSVYSRFDAQRPRKIWPGIDARVVNGERLTMALVDLEPNTPLQEHHHENEQVGFIVQGSLTFVIGGETRTLAAGDTYNISSNVPHSGMTGPEGCVVVDVFAPVRADWDAAPEADPSPSNWRK
ncbi:MAG: cupin domain-containing protein [Candidatus Dormibacteria bacterium]